jgi:hypothetical protein
MTKKTITPVLAFLTFFFGLTSQVYGNSGSVLSPFVWSTNGGSSAAKSLATYICFPDNTCFSSTNIGGIISVGSFDGQTASANGSTISGASIYFQSEDATHPGMVNNSSQTFSGSKTFSSAPTFSTMTAGSVLFAGTAGLLSQNNAKHFWDNSNVRLGIGNAAPLSTLHYTAQSDDNAGAFTLEGTGALANRKWNILPSASGILYLRNLNQSYYNLVQDPSGRTQINGNGSIGTTSLEVQTQNTGDTTFAMKAVGSQSGKLLEARNSSGTPVATIDTSGNIAGNNLSGTNTGDVTIGTANGLSLSSQALSLGTSSTSTTGALTSTDWNTFNGKQASGSYITALTSDVTASGPGSVAATIAGHAVSNAKFRQSAAQSLVGNSTNATADVADISASAADQVMRATSAGTAIGFGSIDLSKSGAVGSSILGAANGGTGAATLTAHGVVIGNGTSAVNITSAGTSGQVLTSNGASSDPTFQAVSLTTVAAWYNGTPSSTLTQNAFTIVKYPTKKTDTGGTGSDYSTSTGLYTVATGNAGTYSITATAEINATSMNYTIIAIYKNGTQIQNSFWQFGSASSQDCAASIALNGVTLADGDTISIYVQTNGSSPTWGTGIGGADQFSIVRTGN